MSEAFPLRDVPPIVEGDLEKHDIFGLKVIHNIRTGRVQMHQNEYLAELVRKYLGENVRLRSLTFPLDHSLNS